MVLLKRDKSAIPDIHLVITQYTERLFDDQSSGSIRYSKGKILVHIDNTTSVFFMPTH